MTASRWMIATVLVGASAPIARAQPSDEPPPQPQPQPQPRVVGHVRRDVTVRTEPKTDGNGVFVAKPGEDLYIGATRGEWTYVERRDGDAGWLPSAELGDAPPQRELEPEPRSAEPERPPAKPKKPRPPDPHVDMPQLITTPTGWLLPAAVLYSRTGLDTGGGFVSDQRVGLGDVAEFGVSTLDQVRSSATASDAGSRLQPYFAASFRMGVAENRLFEYQPGAVLGFRKSFEHDDNGTKTQLAELTLVLSWHLGKRTAIHLGGAFWDASVDDSANMGMSTTLHDRTFHPLSDQLRPFGGLQARPFAKSEIMIDFGWAPRFCYTCMGGDQIRLYPELSWGVRYEVADWMRLESGVRVPAIDKANLLDAQIFGAITFTTWALKHKFDDWK